jgi:hypothetical protein
MWMSVLIQNPVEPKQHAVLICRLVSIRDNIVAVITCTSRVDVSLAFIFYVQLAVVLLFRPADDELPLLVALLLFESTSIYLLTYFVNNKCALSGL